MKILKQYEYDCLSWIQVYVCFIHLKEGQESIEKNIKSSHLETLITIININKYKYWVKILMWPECDRWILFRYFVTSLEPNFTRTTGVSRLKKLDTAKIFSARKGKTCLFTHYAPSIVFLKIKQIDYKEISRTETVVNEVTKQNFEYWILI